MKNILKVNGTINWGDLIISVLIAEGAGILSGFLIMSSSALYNNLKKPIFSPSAIVFPIVWGILYLIMGIAVYRVWLRGQRGADTQKALTLYIVQLLLNFLWPIIFFKYQLYGLAFLELMILLIFILYTTFEFFKVDKLSGILMIPYILWVSYAGVLNFSIWLLNEA